MHKFLIVLPVVLSACMASGPDTGDTFGPVEVSRHAEWAGCDSEGGEIRETGNGGFVCVATH